MPLVWSSTWHKQNNGFFIDFLLTNDEFIPDNDGLTRSTPPLHRDLSPTHALNTVRPFHLIRYCFPVEKANFEVLYKQSPLQFLRRLTFACKFILHASAKSDGFRNKNDELHACGCRILPVLRLGQVFIIKSTFFIEA